MTADVMAIPAGRLNVSRISYLCDLRTSAGKVLPLGAIAEITLGPIRAMGLIARTTLEDQELAVVGHVLRRPLSSPFEFLKQEFEWAWLNAPPGQSLQMLASKHSESLLFSTPRTQQIRDPLAPQTMSVTTAEFARRQMLRNRDQEFFELLADTWQMPRLISHREMADLAA